MNDAWIVVLVLSIIKNAPRDFAIMLVISLIGIGLYLVSKLRGIKKPYTLVGVGHFLLL